MIKPPPPPPHQQAELRACLPSSNKGKNSIKFKYSQSQAAFAWCGFLPKVNRSFSTCSFEAADVGTTGTLLVQPAVYYA